MPRKSKSKSKNENYVYVLELEGGKKYVGRTGNPEQRMKQHFEGNGSQWTKKHKPVKILHSNKCSSLKSSKAAEKIIYERMRDCHGKENVRGAGHTKST
jgi:predicted GIY-YIG superfamily endonuclease